MYIELLEKKITEQQEELQLAQRMLENTRVNQGKDRTLTVRNYQANRQKYLDKLKDALAQNNDTLINSTTQEMKS